MEATTQNVGKLFFLTGLKIASSLKIFMPDIWASKSLVPTPGQVDDIVAQSSGFCTDKSNISENGFLKTGLRIASSLKNFMPDIWVSKSLIPTPGQVRGGYCGPEQRLLYG
jgi:hypothetical protein